MGIDGSRMDHERILHNCHDWCNRCKSQHNAEQQKDDILRFGKVCLDLIKHDDLIV